MVRVAVFASGTGTNLQALIDRLNARADSPARVSLVVADRPEAGALERARAAGIDVQIIPVSGRDAEIVAAEMLAALSEAGIHLVALAGYLRLVPARVIEQYRGRTVNVHPALLPAFGGKGMYGIRVHRAVLAAGCTVTGVTVHLVDERYDEGRIIVQWPVPVVHGDSAESLAARVLTVEHILYPLALEWLARRISAGGTTLPADAHGFHADASAPAFLLADSASALEAEVRGALANTEEVVP
jgi:phosphoribosylglycinamide formyltransferase-1